VIADSTHEGIEMLKGMATRKRRVVAWSGFTLAVVVSVAFYFHYYRVPADHNIRLFDENGELVATGVCDSRSFIDKEDGTRMIRVRLQPHGWAGSDVFDFGDFSRDGEFTKTEGLIVANLHPNFFDHNIRLHGAYTGTRVVIKWTFDHISGRNWGGMFVIDIDRHFPDGL
jgi:hypothetical protein